MGGALTTPDASRPLSASRTVGRVVAVLELLASDGGPLTASQIASQLDLPVSSAHALVRRLTELGYVEMRPGERSYQFGPMMVRLALRITVGMDVLNIARPFIAQLADQTGEDVYLALVTSDGIAYADKVPGSHSLRMSITVGELRLLHCTGVGKLYLAMLSEEKRKALLGRLRLERFTEHTIVDRELLSQQLTDIRAAEVSISEEEHFRGVVGIAAPIFNAESVFVGAVTLVPPHSRFISNREQLINDVSRVAVEISLHLGWEQTTLQP